MGDKSDMISAGVMPAAIDAATALATADSGLSDEGVEGAGASAMVLLCLFLKSLMMSPSTEWGLVVVVDGGEDELALAEADEARGAALTVVAESSIWNSLRCHACRT